MTETIPFFQLADDVWHDLGAAEAWQEHGLLGRLGMAVVVLPIAVLGMVSEFFFAVLGRLGTAYEWSYNWIPVTGPLTGLGFCWALLPAVARELPHRGHWESILMLVFLSAFLGFAAVCTMYLAQAWRAWRRIQWFNSVSLALCLGGGSLRLLFWAWRAFNQS